MVGAKQNHMAELVNHRVITKKNLKGFLRNSKLLRDYHELQDEYDRDMSSLHL